jgi:hypothetical protein
LGGQDDFARERPADLSRHGVHLEGRAAHEAPSRGSPRRLAEDHEARERKKQNHQDEVVMLRQFLRYHVDDGRADGETDDGASEEHARAGADRSRDAPGGPILAP